MLMHIPYIRHMLWFEDGVSGGLWAGDDFGEGLSMSHSRLSSTTIERRNTHERISYNPHRHPRRIVPHPALTTKTVILCAMEPGV